MPSLRTLLVDDSPTFLESASSFLTQYAQIEIVGCVLSGKEALERVPELCPELVLMDLAMPGMNGLEATRQIKAQPVAPYIVILTLNDTSEYRAAALAVGADGFVPKSEFGELLPLIDSLLAERGESINDCSSNSSSSQTHTNC